MPDIETPEDCAELVERFYANARNDVLLGPVFADRIQGHWPAHLATMGRFWATVLFQLPLYQGRPIDRHLGLPICESHFDRWLALWTAAVDARYAGPHAERAKEGARRMAARMLTTISALSTTQ